MKYLKLYEGFNDGGEKFHKMLISIFNKISDNDGNSDSIYDYIIDNTDLEIYFLNKVFTYYDKHNNEIIGNIISIHKDIDNYRDEWVLGMDNEYGVKEIINIGDMKVSHKNELVSKLIKCPHIAEIINKELFNKINT